MSAFGDSLRDIVGADGVLDAPDDLAGYRGDLACTSEVDILVVRPRATAEVAAVVKLCAAERIAITPRGGGTGLAGGATPYAGGIVLSFERLRAIRSVDPIGNVMVAEAGCVLQVLQTAAADAGRLLALDHGGAASSQIGGNLATNAGGNNALRYGSARDQVLGLEVVLADGRVFSALAPLRKNTAGYDLKHAFVGSEGTLGLITAAALRLHMLPCVRATACVGVVTAADALALFGEARQEFGDTISAFELIPRSGLELHFRHVGARREPFDPPTPWLVLVEVDSPSRHFPAEAAMAAFAERTVQTGLVLGGTIAASEAQRQALWRMREGLAHAMIDLPAGLKSDTAVPIGRVPEFIARATEAVAAVLPSAVPVPFGHLGDGNIHFNVVPAPDAPAGEFAAHKTALARAIDDVTLQLGGTVAAEHGIGSLKRTALRRMRSAAEIDLMQALKNAFDPSGLLNPDKIF